MIIKKKKVSFIATWLFILLFISCNAKNPVITSIDPKIGRMGEVITLKGNNFGSSRDESYVTIAGITPTSSSYYSWENNQIIVRVPELGETGLVYVHIKGKKSNGVLFSNSAIVPRPVDGEELGLQPRITSVTPQTGTPGSLIIINGNNFGVSRESSLHTSSLHTSALHTTGGVFFSWDYDSGALNPYFIREPEFIEVSEIESGYEFWSSREIRVRLPDGAVSGNIEVRTPHGSSRPVYFDVSGKPGSKIIKNKLSYTINYSVDIRVLEAANPNTLYLWVPMPISSSSQRNITLISRNAEPFIENHRGVSLYKLDNLGSGTNQSITLSFRVESYAVETVIRPQSLRQETVRQESTAQQPTLSAMYTQSSDLIPGDDPRIRTLVNSIIGREQNPYTRARMLYDWILRNMEISSDLPPSAGVINALETRQADPYTTALLFTTMARAARIPCIPVAGILIDKNGITFRHYWTEFWIDSFGWLPVDPVMGAGAAAAESISMQELNAQNPANYYFGSIDNSRIAFSRGEIILSQMENRGRLVSHNQSYSLQNIWEEASGGLESYSSLWSNITISGVYHQ